MSQATWYANKDARTALRQSDNLKQGAGASPALPFGYYNGYIYRSGIGFSDSLSAMNRVDKAVFWFKTSDQYYVSFGSDPDMNIALITSAWSEGSSEGLSTSNGGGIVYPFDYDTGTLVQKDVTTAINTWVSVDITTLIQKAKVNGVFYGLQISSTGTGSGDVGEIWSREKGSSYRPYIVVDYTNNVAPNAPTLTFPATGQSVTIGTPTLQATGSDPDAGDTLAKYHIQVSSNSGFSALVWDADNQTAGISGFNISRAYAGTALVAGSTYWWRVYTYDAAGLKSPASAVRTFKRNALPTCSSMSGNFVATIHNLSDTGTTLSPKPQFVFTVTSDDTVTGYQIEIDGGIYSYTGSWANGATITHKHSTAWVNLANHTVRWRAKDAEGYGAWSTLRTAAVKFAQGIYQLDMAGKFSPSATLGTVTGTVLVMYRTATLINGGGTVSTWSASLPTGTYNYLNIMVRTASSGTAPVQPKLTSLKIAYTDSDVMPLSWSTDTGFSSDTGVRRYGLKCITYVHGGVAGTRNIYQDIPNLAPDTDYSVSMWVWLENWATDHPVGIHVTPAIGWTGYLAQAYANTPELLARARAGWTRLSTTFRTEPGQTGTRVVLRVGASDAGYGTLATGSTAHIDAVMLSEGTVAPVWTPALVGEPAVMDAQGIIVDGTAGGIFRVLNTSGVAIEMGAVGRDMVFGGDVSFGRDTTGRLMVSTPVGATSPRLGMTFDTGHTSSASGFFIWNQGDTVARAALGKWTGGEGAVTFGPGNAGADVALFRGLAGVLQLNSGIRMAGPTSYQYIQLFSGGTMAGGTMFDHGTGGSSVGRIMAYQTDTVAREIMRWEGTTVPLLGFYGATAIAKPAVTGSKGANAALTSLMTALASLGLVTNSTT